MPRPQTITNQLREECREAFQSATQHIAKIARGEANDVTSATQIRAYDSLGKYGIGPQPNLQLQKQEWLRLVAEVSAGYIKGEEYEKWWKELTSTFDSIL